ncbi:hypothetical protein [Pseudanabaena sp. PCC 6802]|uniref:hypothetical protein n=1 Tax=Pseudanabaena sp. PCC 6802 TaxID=118173 RepID=UPI00034ADBE4|nr:hypothetical protein [Pseudanabaena sp. PCC 6802]
MTTPRWDETWHRLREWTSGQGLSERLSAQVLLADGFSDLDPSHPLGGKDGGKDAMCSKDGQLWVMGVYFPSGQQSFACIKKKFLSDAKGARKNSAEGFVFVTNQELMLAERRDLANSATDIRTEIYHLERMTTILDTPAFASIRKQFLGIDYLELDTSQQLTKLREEMLSIQKRIESVQTGGDSFCYFMLYHFDLGLSIAQNIVVIRIGEFPLYDLRIRVRDMDASRDIFKKYWGEINSPADFLIGRWSLLPAAYYRVSFHARNGIWSQDLILKRSEQAECWLAATRVLGRNGRDVTLLHIDNDFETEFGSPEWRD